MNTQKRLTPTEHRINSLREQVDFEIKKLTHEQTLEQIDLDIQKIPLEQRHTIDLARLRATIDIVYSVSE